MTNDRKPRIYLPLRLNGVLLLLLASGFICGQDERPVGPKGVNVPVDVLVNSPEEQKLWQVPRAWVAQTFYGTDGYVRVRNTSMVAFASARFYAEYYDDTDRMCLTLVFVQDVNLDGARGPFRPGEIRTLAGKTFVAPAVRPRKVRLWFLGEASAPESPYSEVIAPVTIRSGTRGDMEGIRLSKHSDQPLVPLALVDAAIDTKGMPISINIVAARDDASRQWSHDLISKLRFAPATRGWEPIGARTLILIRAHWLHPPRDTPAAPAFEDPWVQSYLALIKGKSDYPIVNLLRVWSEEGSDMFRYFSVGTDWCLPAFRWVWDPIHHDMRREWLSPSEM